MIPGLHDKRRIKDTMRTFKIDEDGLFELFAAQFNADNAVVDLSELDSEDQQDVFNEFIDDVLAEQIVVEEDSEADRARTQLDQLGVIIDGLIALTATYTALVAEERGEF